MSAQVSLDEFDDRQWSRIVRPTTTFAQYERRSVSQNMRPSGGVATKAVPGKGSKLVAASTNDEERLFDVRVELKKATATYAMHLADDVRAKIFAEFDYLLEHGAWDMEDVLPTVFSYRQFLKWLVYTSDRSWSSFGVGDDGSLLIAWKRSDSLMTASFGQRVRWTQEFYAEGERQLASGNYTLQHFAHQANVFLGN